MSLKHQHDMSIALLKACGVDPSSAVAVRYEHKVGELPVIIVTKHVWNPDATQFDSVQTRFVAAD